MATETITSAATTSLSPSDTTPLIDAYAADVFAARIAQAGTISTDYEKLWEEIKSLYCSGGKRMRPYMTLLAYQAFGGKTINDIIPAALSQELLHQAMLIHDDIIDRDLVRYGVANLTGRFETAYADHIEDAAERRHFAQSAALLGGDLLLSEAHRQISLLKVEPARVAAAHDVLSDSVMRVVGGELLDTEASFREASRVDPLTIAAQKTASYSFISPLTMGAILAGAPKKQLDLLKEIGNSVGIAFQLRDDLLGVFGDEAVTGKSAANDIREGKRTLLIDEFYKRATKQQITQFEQSFGSRTASDADVQVIRDLLIQTKTKQAIEQYIIGYRQTCTTQIDALEINEIAKESFKTLIRLSLERER